MRRWHRRRAGEAHALARPCPRGWGASDDSQTVLGTTGRMTVGVRVQRGSNRSGSPHRAIVGAGAPAAPAGKACLDSHNPEAALPPTSSPPCVDLGHSPLPLQGALSPTGPPIPHPHPPLAAPRMRRAACLLAVLLALGAVADAKLGDRLTKLKDITPENGERAARAARRAGAYIGSLVWAARVSDHRPQGPWARLAGRPAM